MTNTNLTKQSSGTTISILGRIMPVSEKDRQVHGAGRFNSGEMIGYFKPSYESGGSTYIVEEGDVIARPDESDKFRVVEVVQREKISDTVIYIKTRLRRIV